ncbi:amidohydrolase/deacetylase family metallohydrolase [Alkalicoccobacillus plakortidis]|uniref:Amidohydrolase/deacetylase family metallohydrolase n=1 Tax=Alkalicoccobacillus plakortidis TaxID=444060 RepID=A0ABT0XMF0_9BACI|nr:amidohydrolase/deacetylase family metallohydrolase [Alkalicoccobacillus plakortidis]MCM2676409.1 amidohydrolase/deacetylase family metallohydrolase [Alkalicoccobacillus plakortidis]
MEDRIVLRNVMKLTGEPMDLVIDLGTLIEIAEPGQGDGAVIDCTGMYVSSGWIDLHVHAFPELEPYGDEIDEIGVKQGVTTIVDAGSTGADRIDELLASARDAKTNVFAFLNISRIGLERVDELSNLAWINRQAVMDAISTHGDLIAGLKARISRSVVGESGLEPLRVARELSVETGKPLMVHIGSGPPDIEEIVPLLEANDVITHYLNGKKNNLFNDNMKPLSVLRDAIARGVQLDVGHGTASFSFKVAEAAKSHGIHFDTISTDIYRGNRLNGPVYSMANLLTKFLSLGYSLQEVIDGVTVNPARWLGMPELAHMKVGEPANLTLFSVQDQEVTLVDSEGEERVSTKTIMAEGVFARGEYIKC